MAFFREHGLGASIGVLVLGVFLLIFALFCFFWPHLLKTTVVQKIDGYDYWLLILAPFIVAIAAFYLVDGILNRRKFERWVGTKRKSEFIHRIRDLEDLTTILPERYGKRLEEQKRGFGLKR